MPSQPRPFTQDAAFTILFVLIATILVLVLSVSRRWSATDAALRQLDRRISALRATLSSGKPPGPREPAPLPLDLEVEAGSIMNGEGPGHGPSRTGRPRHPHRVARGPADGGPAGENRTPSTTRPFPDRPARNACGRPGFRARPRPVVGHLPFDRGPHASWVVGVRDGPLLAEHDDDPVPLLRLSSPGCVVRGVSGPAHAHLPGSRVSPLGALNVRPRDRSSLAPG